jgi:hypothetical protein
LADQPNEKGIRKVLTSFRTGSRTNIYKAAYDQTVKRMENQSPDALERAKRTIGWITNVKRPLTVEELEEALAIEIESSDLDETNITDIEQLTSYCCGLVIRETRPLYHPDILRRPVGNLVPGNSSDHHK